MRVLGRIGLFAVLWLLAWGRFNLAYLLSGIVVAAALLVAFPLAPRRGAGVRPRPVGVAHLAGHVAWQLIASNIVMARQILRPRIDARPGVLAHRLQRPSDEVVTVMTSVIALSPGTITVDVDRRSAVIYIHFFRLDDIEAARAGLRRLERLVTGAMRFGEEAP